MTVSRPIQLLPDPLIDQIAAGEVIERPASVVKELVENSLDGGARRIDVNLTAGGLECIQVTDDGWGMSAEDLPMSVVAHATSKISTPQDLIAITSRGFRGEALASMGAVGHLEVASRLSDSDEGYAIDVMEGRSSEIRPVAMPEGTRVTLSHLFRHLPARRKFLKSPRAEVSRCQEVLIKMALTQPQVHFVLRVDGKVKQDWPAVETMDQRVARVLKIKNVEQGEATRPGMKVACFVAPPAEARQTRTGQYFFLMGRPIRDRALSQVLWQSSREFVPDNRHPMVVTQIEVDPGSVDVNVHPTKEEVRFEQPRRIAALLSEAFKNAVAGGDYAVSFRPTASSSQPQQVAENRAPYSPAALTGRPRAERPVEENWVAPGRLGVMEEGGEQAPPRASMQLHGAYIVAETDEGISILDQHALHERILLMKLRRQMLAGEVEKQVLLLPHLVDLMPAEVSVLMDLADDLRAVGFDMSDHGDGVVAVSALPVTLDPEDLSDTLQDILARADGLSDPEAIRLAVARICACRSAVKAGHPLKPSEIEALLREHSEEDFSFACEHGRPTHLKISLSELARGFHRH